MATVLDQGQELSVLDSFEMPPFPVRRWTLAEYRRLAEIGVLTEDDDVELLEGWIVPKVTRNPPHDATIAKLDSILRRSIPENTWVLRAQLAIDTVDSEPEPDIAVVHGPNEQYYTRHPTLSDVVFVIEVADTTLKKDRRKSRIYAAAGIPSYWIINLADRRIERYRQPDTATREYRDVANLTPEEAIGLELAGQPLATYAVADLLPPAVPPAPTP